MKMYVGNLSYETTENDLHDLFEQHGTVNEVHLVMDQFTAKSRGFAFVTMDDGAQANTAMNALNGRQLGGRTLTVNEARPREERARPRSGSGGKRSFAGTRR
jgi:cold-inducible RNA-binding protein